MRKLSWAPAVPRDGRCFHLPTLLLIVGGALAVVPCAGKADEGNQRSNLPAWSKLSLPQRRELRDAYRRPPELWPAPNVEPTVKWRELGLLPAVSHPDDNPYSQEKAELGRILFFDKRLSGARNFACATCHDPDRGWANGHESRWDNPLWEMPRDPPGLLNVGLRRAFGWGGGAKGLEEWSRKAIENPLEMDASAEIVVDRLGALPGYRARFRAAFGDDAVTIDRITDSLATFQRTLAGGTSWFDEFLRGNRTALSDEAVYGLHIFRTDGRCMNCHHGPDMTDNEFHGVGLTYFRRKYEDLGRYYVTGLPSDSGRFKTPSLRDVSRTGRYMHRGTFALPGVLNMFNSGMPNIKPPEGEETDLMFPKKSPLLKPLRLSPGELDCIRAFLESLAERPAPYARPELPGDAVSTLP